MPSTRQFSGMSLSEAVVATMDRLEGRYRRAFKALIDEILGSLELKSVLGMVGSGDDLVAILAMIDNLPVNAVELQNIVRQAVAAGGKTTAKAVGLEGRFDLTNPNAVNYARTLSADLVTGITNTTRQTLRDIVADAVQGDLTPAETRRRIKEEVGLTPQQSAALRNYRKQLAASGNSKAQINSMASRYAEKMLRQRSATIARTEVARAVNIGQREFWKQMQGQQNIPQTAMRVWMTAADERVCPTCGPMNGQLAPVDGSWSTANGPLDIPHAHPNCRCTSGLVFTNKVKKVDPLGWEMWTLEKGGEGGLKQWFDEEWVDLSRPKKGGGFEPCGRKDASSGKYPKCVPASRAAKMTPDEIKSAIRRKRRAESTKRREGKKPIMVPTISKANVPADMELYNKVKEEAKRKFDVYPSAYANGWLVQEYKRRGGKYKTVEKGDYLGHPFRGNQWSKGTSVAVFERAAGSPVAVNIRDHEGSVSVKLAVTALTGAEVDPRFASYAGQRRGDTEVGSILWYKETGVIEGIGVAREFQRKGVATALLEQARAYAESKGYPKVVHSDKLTEDGAAWAAVTKEDEMISLPERPIAVDALMKGDYVGHPFRGNQWTGGRGGVLAAKPPKTKVRHANGFEGSTRGAGTVRLEPADGSFYDQIDFEDKEYHPVQQLLDMAADWLPTDDVSIEGVDFDDVDIELMSEALDALYVHSKNFPGVHLDAFGWEDTGGAGGYVRHGMGTTEMRLDVASITKGAKGDRVIEKFDEGHKTGWFPPSDLSVVQQIATHEFGHAVRVHLMRYAPKTLFKMESEVLGKLDSKYKTDSATLTDKEIQPNHAMGSSRANAFELYLLGQDKMMFGLGTNLWGRPALGAAELKRRIGEVSAKVSRYGSSKGHELFAELFSETYSGDPDSLRPVAGQFFDSFEKYWPTMVKEMKANNPRLKIKKVVRQ